MTVPNKPDLHELLKVAIEKGCVATAKFALESHQGQTGQDPDRDAEVLHRAIEGGQTAIVELLLQKDVNSNSIFTTKGKSRFTALQQATQHHRADAATIEVLLRYKADPNLVGGESGPTDDSLHDDSFCTPLYLAAKRWNGAVEMVTKLMEWDNVELSKANPGGSKSVIGETPLDGAIRYNKDEVVEKLLSRLGSDIHLGNEKTGQTPLDRAREESERFSELQYPGDDQWREQEHHYQMWKRIQRVIELIEQHAVDSLPENPDAVHRIHKALISKKVKPDEFVDIDGNIAMVPVMKNLLKFAVKHGKLEKVEFLMQVKLVVEHVSSHWGELLRDANSHDAALASETVRLLLSAIGPHGKLDVQEALDDASACGHCGVVEQLLRYAERTHAKPKEKSLSIDKPLQNASSYGHDGVVKLLLEYAELTKVPCGIDEALKRAAGQEERTTFGERHNKGDGYVSIVKQLVEFGKRHSIPINVPSLLEAAASKSKNGQPDPTKVEIVKYLLENVDANVSIDPEVLVKVVGSGPSDAVKLLIERLDPNEKVFPTKMSKDDELGTLLECKAVGESFDSLAVKAVLPACRSETLLAGLRAQCLRLSDMRKPNSFKVIRDRLVTNIEYMLNEWLSRDDADGRVELVKGQGWTALHVAVHCGLSSIVGKLLEADGHLYHMDDRNQGQESVFDLASQVCEQAKSFSYEHRKTIELLLKHACQHQSDPNAEVTKDGGRLLHVAARFGMIEQVVELLKKKPEIDATDHSGATPLAKATEAKHLKVVDMLCQAGANAKRCNLLHWVAQQADSGQDNCRGIPKLAEILLKHGADANAIYQPLRTGNGDGYLLDMKPLFDETFRSKPGGKELRTEGMKRLREHRKAVQPESEAGKAVSMDGSCSLHRTAAFGCVAVAKLLIANGADVNAPMTCGTTPLHLAVANKHEAMTQLLLSKGARAGNDIRWKSEKTGLLPLRLAAANGDAMCVKRLLDDEVVKAVHEEWKRDGISKPDSTEETVRHEYINSLDGERRTPLHLAVSSWQQLMGEIAETEQEIERSAERRSDWGAWDGWKEEKSRCMQDGDAVGVLLQHGADPMLPDRKGKMPLHDAVQHWDLDCATRLLDGAVVKAVHRRLVEAGELPSSSSDKDAKYIYTNKRDTDGHTPLYLAAGSVSVHSTNAEQLVKLLVEHGADALLPDEQGRTLLHHAAVRGDFRCATQLLEPVVVKAVRCQLIEMGELQSGSSDEEVKRMYVNKLDGKGNAPLHLAINSKAGMAMNVVVKLVQDGADATLADGQRRTPLHLAAKCGSAEDMEQLLSPEVMKSVRAKLIEAGKLSDSSSDEEAMRLYVNRLDDKGRTPLHLVVKDATCVKGDEMWMRTLASKQAPVVIRIEYDSGKDLGRILNESGGKMPRDLKDPQSDAERKVRFLLEHGANVMVFDKEAGRLPLHYAAEKGDIWCVKGLLDLDGRALSKVRDELVRRGELSKDDAGAQVLSKYVNLPDHKNYTPLHLVAICHSEKLRTRVEVEEYDEGHESYSPSHNYWVDFNYVATFAAAQLLECGADLESEVSGEERTTPLLLGVDAGKPQLLQALQMCQDKKIIAPEKVRNALNVRDARDKKLHPLTLIEVAQKVEQRLVNDAKRNGKQESDHEVPGSPVWQAREVIELLKELAKQVA